MHGMTLACPVHMAKAHEITFDLCSRVVQSPLQLSHTQLLLHVEKGNCLWSGFLHGSSIFQVDLMNIHS